MRELCFDVPLDRLLLTTDAPHSPASEVGAAGVPALPCHTPFIAAAVASQKRTTVAAVLNAAAENSRRFFGVDFSIAPPASASKKKQPKAAKEASHEQLQAGSTATAASSSSTKSVSTTAVAAEQSGSGGNVGVVQSKRFKCTRCKKKCKFAVRRPPAACNRHMCTPSPTDTKNNAAASSRPHS